MTTSHIGDTNRLSVSAAARLLGVSVSSLRAWAAAGEVPHDRTPGGHRRFHREELRAWLAEHGGDLPDHGSPRGGGLIAGRMEMRPEAAGEIASRAEEISRSAVALIADGAITSRRRTDARMARMLEATDHLARAVRSGDLGPCLREAEWHAYRHGASGLTATQPVGEVLALGRAVERVLRDAGYDDHDQVVVRHAIDRMVWAAAAGLAAGRRSREDARGGHRHAA
jgi:excisionase family DNA binding protein